MHPVVLLFCVDMQADWAWVAGAGPVFAAFWCLFEAWCYFFWSPIVTKSDFAFIMHKASSSRDDLVL